MNIISDGENVTGAASGMAKEKFKIRDRHYKVKDVKLHKRLLGDCTNDGNIRINNRLKGKLYEATKLHEILHGCVFEYSKYDHDDDMVEDVVYAIEKGLRNVARHNPAGWLILANRLTK